MKKLKEKSLKSLLIADFQPLTQTAEGELRGGFLAVTTAVNDCLCIKATNNCECAGNNCRCNGNNCNCGIILEDNCSEDNNCNCYIFSTTEAPTSNANISSFSLW